MRIAHRAYCLDPAHAPAVIAASAALGQTMPATVQGPPASGPLPLGAWATSDPAAFGYACDAAVAAGRIAGKKDDGWLAETLRPLLGVVVGALLTLMGGAWSEQRTARRRRADELEASGATLVGAAIRLAEEWGAPGGARPSASAVLAAATDLQVRLESARANGGRHDIVTPAITLLLADELHALFVDDWPREFRAQRAEELLAKVVAVHAASADAARHVRRSTAARRLMRA